MDNGLPQVVLYVYNIYLENRDSDNCAQLLEKEFNKIYGIKHWMMGMIAILIVWNLWIFMMLMMIALVMIMMSPIRMSIFAEWIGNAIAHQKGKIDFVRSINV